MNTEICDVRDRVSLNLSKQKPLPRAPQTILLIIIAGIGDYILATKAIRAVHAGFPDSEIHLLTSTQSAPLAKSNPRLSRVWVFPIRELRKNKRKLLSILILLWKMRRMRFDVAINLHPVGSRSGAIKMGMLFGSLRARQKVAQGLWPLQGFLSKPLPADIFENKHIADAMCDLVAAVGGRPDAQGLELFGVNPEGAPSGLLSATDRIGGARLLIGVNPGSDVPAKRWPSEHFAGVANALGRKFQATVMLLGGPGEEAVAQKIADRVLSHTVNLAGKISLAELQNALSICDLFITNDSGPMHIAAALGIPTVALFGSGQPLQFGPYTATGQHRVLQKPAVCRPCKRCRFETPACLDGITPEEVVHACLELLKTTGKIPYDLNRNNERIPRRSRQGSSNPEASP
jgi:ADP-heptose:LPS heptosyltransferase